MAPTFSKIAVAPTPGITISSGLRCCHADCHALFSSIDDSEEHAFKAHSGNVDATTCKIYEYLLDSGQVRLHRVLDEEEGENPEKISFSSTCLDTSAKRVAAVRDDRQSNKQQIRSAKAPTSVVQETCPSPSRAPVVESLPPSQPFMSTPSSRALSRQSTEPFMDIPSSSSSSFSTSSFLSSSSFSSFSQDSGNNEDQKLCRILDAVQEISDQCRICWVHRETTRPHLTFRCPKGICSSNDWNRFKVGLRFPKNTVCYFCLAPFAAPFDHTRAPPGTRPSPDDCDYPDVLKELVYILYQNKSLRGKIFSKLGVSEPSSLPMYQRFIGKRQ